MPDTADDVSDVAEYSVKGSAYRLTGLVEIDKPGHESRDGRDGDAYGVGGKCCIQSPLSGGDRGNGGSTAQKYRAEQAVGQSAGANHRTEQHESRCGSHDNGRERLMLSGKIRDGRDVRAEGIKTGIQRRQYDGAESNPHFRQSVFHDDEIVGRRL